MRYLEDGTHNILVAVDFSQPCQRAFDAAVRMARVFGATLHILHVNEEEALLGGHSSDELTHFLDTVGTRRATWMADFESAAAEAGVDARSLLRDGDPAETILAVADELHVGMLVLGTEGARQTGLAAGSVARKVLRHAERPVLVVSRHAGVAPPDAEGTFDHVVYPTDFTPASKAGLKLATLLARRTAARLTLVNVLRLPDPLPAPPGADPILIPPSVAARLRAGLETQMAALIAGLDAAHVESVVSIGASPAEGIADAVRQTDADLILIPRHSAHGVRSYFFGRTAENLARIAPVPVLLFDPRA